MKHLVSHCLPDPSCPITLGSYHGDEAANEAEVGEVVGVDGGGRVDLQAVVVLASILKEAVHGVEHLVRQEEEPLPGAKGRESAVTSSSRSRGTQGPHPGGGDSHGPAQHTPHEPGARLLSASVGPWCALAKVSSAPGVLCAVCEGHLETPARRDTSPGCWRPGSEQWG